MIRLKGRWATRVNLFMICGILVLWMGYIVGSYYQTREDFKAQNASLLLKTQGEVSEAVDQFYQFLGLTEARLLGSLEARDNFVPILSWSAEHFLRKKFPIIISLSFVLTSDPATVYSRFGEARLTSQVKTGTHKEGVVHLGEETFEMTKTLYDKRGKSFGTLQSTFSLTSFLRKNFTENDIHIVPLVKNTLEKDKISFTVKNIPYAFVLNSPPLSFWQFLLDFKFQILLAFLYGMSLVFLGHIFGKWLNKRRLAVYRAEVSQLKEEGNALKDKSHLLRAKQNEMEHLMALKKTAQKEHALLIGNLQERRQHMAGQIIAILNLTEKLITTSGTEDTRSKKEIHEIFQESVAISRHLLNGFPMKGTEEDIDVLQSLTTIKKIFMPTLVERKVDLDIKDGRKKKDKILLFLDKVIFEVVLHNIFYLIVDRLISKNVLKIEIRGNDPLDIVFYDNGYEIRDKIQNAIHQHIPENTLCLGKQRLREFMGSLGWQLSFHTDKNALNVIKLSIPRQGKADGLPSNVVNLFGFKSLLK